jgi:ribonuclease J
MEIAEEQEPLNVPPVAPGRLRLFSLGGLETPGERNMQVLEYGDDIITIDCGTWFADAEVLPGVDYVIPNSKYLRENSKRIRGMLMCHGHLDHIGGLPHIAPLLGFPPIHCTPLTKAFIEKRQEEFGNLGRFKISTFKPRDIIQLGVFRIEVFHINHNIPEAVGFAIHTPVGTIVHSGDFKFDLSPTMGKPADVGHIAQIGERGVMALMVDSTDAGYPGHQISETDVQRTLEDVFKNTKGRLIAVTFSSLITRVQMLISLAEKYGRKVVLEGRSMKAYTEIAHNLKVMQIRPGTLIDVRQMQSLPDSRVLVIGTGAQAEEFAMLMRIANVEHKFIKIKPGDTVLFSSSVIPGNERGVEALQDSLTRQGAEIIERNIMDVHAGGHGKDEDIKLMMTLVRPRYLMPMHANYTRRKLAAELGTKVGIPRQNSFVIENGDVLEFDQNGVAQLTKFKVPAGNVLVDGLGEGDISQIVLRDRKELAAEGILVIVITADAHGKLVREPELISRGFVSLDHSPALGRDIVAKVKETVGGISSQTEVNVDFLNTRVRNALAEFIWGKTERRPMVLPLIVRA